SGRWRRGRCRGVPPSERRAERSERARCAAAQRRGDVVVTMREAIPLDPPSQAKGEDKRRCTRVHSPPSARRGFTFVFSLRSEGGERRRAALRELAAFRCCGRFRGRKARFGGGGHGLIARVVVEGEEIRVVRQVT